MKLNKYSFIAPALAVLMGTFIILADKYTGQEYRNKLESKYVAPLINRRIYGLVMELYRTDLENIKRGEFARRSVQVNYKDIATSLEDSFDTQLDYETYISVGDTIIKAKNEDFFMVKKRNGQTKLLSVRFN